MVSDRFHARLTNEAALKTCGCPNGTKVDLWTKQDLRGDSKFGFEAAFALRTRWCEMHGSEFCERLLRADEGVT